LLVLGSDPNEISAKEKNIIGEARTVTKDKDAILRALKLALEYGFDLELLTNAEIKWLTSKAVSGLLI
jgi:hypothetical protein